MFNWWSRKVKKYFRIQENNFSEIDDIRQNQFKLPKTTTIESLQLRSLQQLGINIESMPNSEDNNTWGEKKSIIWNLSKWKEQNGLRLVNVKCHLLSYLKLQRTKTNDEGNMFVHNWILLNGGLFYLEDIIKPEM